jgi:hypothetical protein
MLSIAGDARRTIQSDPFHDDDPMTPMTLTSLEVPARLPAGLYATRLRAGKAEERIPFVVAAKAQEHRWHCSATATYGLQNEAMGFNDGRWQMTGQLAVSRRPICS